MTIIEIIYEAKCKHCIFLEQFYKGKLKRHRCVNLGSYKSEWESVPARTKACENFKLS